MSPDVVGNDPTGARCQRIARSLEPRLLPQLPAAVVATDEQDAIVYWNAEASRLFGHCADAVLGRPISDVGVWPAELSDGEAVAPPSRRREGEHDVKRAGGTPVRVWTTLERVDDDEVGFHGVLGVSVDLSGRRQPGDDLAHRALHDPVTGLPNGMFFLEHLKRALARDARSGRQTAVLFADLDDFKSVNERYGHLQGDAVLQVAGRQMSSAVRAGDVTACLGGDRFAICCEGVADRSDALAVGQRVVDALVHLRASGEDSLTSVSASVGVAMSSAGLQPESLLRHAELAVRRAKERGKAGVELFDDELRDRAKRNREMVADLEGAVAHGGIDVVYQPEFVIDTGQLFGFEALARWTHPQWGPVAPGDFIRAAELSGSIGELGAQVLATACRVLAGWPHDGARQVRMTVNVSALQLADPSFPEAVRRVLSESGVRSGLLCLEITESALGSGDMAARALGELKALGVEVSVDDFGTEYSSLSRLQQFPIDYLKIDRGFVSGMTNRPVDAAIIDALLGLARSLGIRTIAKGVEDAEQLDALKAAGCDLGQGFYWSRPLPATQAAGLVEQARSRPPS